MSTSNDPGDTAPADAHGGEAASSRYRAAITAMIEEAIRRRELAEAADALARGFAEIIYGCNSLGVAADMMRRAGNRLFELSVDLAEAPAAEERPEGATLQ
jgi:hypothetical protein